MTNDHFSPKLSLLYTLLTRTELETWKEGRKEAVKAEKERKAARNNKGGMSDQELLELQQKLFMEAKNQAPVE